MSTPVSNVVKFQNEDIHTKSDDNDSEREDTFVNEVPPSHQTTFNIRVNQPKIQINDKSGHFVNFNLTFLLALPGTFNNTRHLDSMSTRASTADPLGRNTQQLFHLEFNLFPETLQKEAFKTDIGFYGSYAKIYPEKSESRTLPCWNDGEDTWIGFQQRLQVWVTDAHIRALINHKVIVKVWDSPDKCATKVRFDRPKPPRSALKNQKKTNNEFANWIESTVVSLSKKYQQTASYKEDKDRVLPHQTVMTNMNKGRRKQRVLSSATSSKATTKSKSTQDNQLALYASDRESLHSQMESYGQLEKLIDSNKDSKPNHHTIRSKTFIIEPSNIKFPDPAQTNDADNSNVAPSETEEYNLNGRCCLNLQIRDLFVSSHTISRVPCSYKSIEDMFCQLTAESSILTDKQIRSLQPLTVNVRKLENLPINSQDIEETVQHYQPIHCEYNFSDLPTYQTLQRLHNSQVYFEDISVILLGDLDPLKLKDQLINSNFTIKLFDKIPKYIPPTNKLNPIRHFGEAKMDISDLLTHKIRYLDLMVPIVPVSIPTSQNNLIEDGSLKNKYIDYLECGTTMKVSFQLADTINVHNDLFSQEIGNHDGFSNRLILINKNLKLPIINEKLMRIIVEYNCNVLNFDTNSVFDDKKTYLDNIFRKRKFTNNKASLNGYFIADNELEILIIQSSSDKLKKFYHDHIVNLLNRYNEHLIKKELIVLYDESCDMQITDEYPVLSMSPVNLLKHLSFLISQPMLYVRDTIPKECADGISKLYYLTKSNFMINIIRNKLIPTSQMFESIIEYLSVKPTKKILTKEVEIDRENPKLRRKFIKTAPVKLQTHNKSGCKDSEDYKQRLERSKYLQCSKPIFSYSSQSKNAINEGIAEIRKSLNPKRLYTYSQDYLSASFDLVDLEKTYKIEEESNRNKFLKWNHRGHTTFIQDYKSDILLDEYRKSELKNEKWQENQLHTSFMQPTLPERDKLCDKSFKYLQQNPVKIDLDGLSMWDSYAAERSQWNHRRSQEITNWTSKVCVDLDASPTVKVHRVGTATEQRDMGRLSANQIDKFSKGLRKTVQPTKKGIIPPRIKHDPNKIPGIYVHPLKGPDSYHNAFTICSTGKTSLMKNHIPIIKDNLSELKFSTIHVTGQNDKPPYALFHGTNVPNFSSNSGEEKSLKNSPFKLSNSNTAGYVH